MSNTIYVLNGPNLNLLGTREPDVYGSETLEDVKQSCLALAAELGVSIDFRQTNSESQLIDWIQEARNQAGGIVINPAGYTHTSVAILDALNIFEGPVLEVHISEVHKREEFRQVSYVSKRANGVIKGCGTEGYLLALRRVVSLIQA